LILGNGKEIFPFSTISRLFQPRLHSILGAFSPGIKLSGREVDHSSSPSAGGSNDGAVPQHPIRLHGVVHRNEFTFKACLDIPLQRISSTQEYAKNSVASVCKRTISTERLLLVSEVTANFLADRVCHMVIVTNPYGRILGFLDRNRYYFFQAAAQFYS
jgi:hypothetical protein